MAYQPRSKSSSDDFVTFLKGMGQSALPPEPDRILLDLNRQGGESPLQDLFRGGGRPLEEFLKALDLLKEKEFVEEVPDQDKRLVRLTPVGRAMAAAIS